jgi:aconitate hydratase
MGGARIHQAGCMGCIGMGQAPATGRNSLRTMPRNFPGRSGTKEDAVWLCSPETAAASALTGVITDPRDWARDVEMEYPKLDLPERNSVNTKMLVPPLDPEEAERVEPVKGPNISSLPELSPLPDELEAPVLLKVGDNISTDEISPAGARALPLRSNIPKLAMFSFSQVDDSYPERAQEAEDSGHIIVAGENYGQGSSREHAAIAPRYLGLRVVIAKSFARIHWQNLANYGILALEFEDPDDYESIDQDDTLRIQNLDSIEKEDTLEVDNVTQDSSFTVRHRLSPRQVKDVIAGGIIPRLAGEK